MPHFVDVFLMPIRDNKVAQVLVMAMMLGILFDVLIGVIGAAVRHEVKSSKMREGVQHKLSELGLLIAADIIDGIIAGGFDLGIAPVLVTTAGYLSVMEVFSICENCIKLNPDFVEIPIIGTVARLVHEAKGNGKKEDKNVASE